MTVNRPVDRMLREAARRRSAHMPGHKGRSPYGAADLYALDTTELPVTDDLMHPRGAVLEAERLYAEAAGAARTLFLTGGSTAAVHVMLQLWAREGDTVILPRNAHLSAVNACVIGGLRIAWIPCRQTADGYVFIAEQDALQTLKAHPGAKCILLTRPDYYGGMIPLARISALAGAMGIRLTVDEAHGAHLPWLEGFDSAASFGADAWAQSAHKTLPALTGSALLHLRDPADERRAMALLRREQSSSPSYLLVRSVDDARAWMAAEGAARLRETVRAANALREHLPDAARNWAGTGYEFDPTRLTVDAPQGGFALEAAFRDKGLDVEMADARRVVLILTAMDTPADIRAMEALFPPADDHAAQIPGPDPLPPLPEAVLTVREAAMAQSEPVPLTKAAGRIAAEAVGLYPPGIPLAVPGERLTEDILAQLLAAPEEMRFGTEGDTIHAVRDL